MHKLIVLFLVSLISQQLSFSASIVLDTDEQVVFTSPGATSYDLVTEHGAGGGNTKDDPSEVYIPILNTGGTQAQHNVLGSDIPDIAAGTTITANQRFSFSVDIDLETGDSTPQYIYISYYNSTDEEYRIFKVLGDVSGDVDSQFLSVDLDDLCSTTYSIKDCTSIGGGNSNVEEDDLYYVFLSSTVISLGTSADYPTTHTGGFFLQTNLSTRIYNGTDGAPTVTLTQSETVTGDESLYISYKSSAAFSDHKETIILSLPTASAIQTYSAAIATATIVSDENEFPAVDEGAKIQLKDLVNNQTYNIALSFVDKYQFSTMLTASQLGIPLEIAEFLKEQSCYFVSAGFGRPHYILNYFRLIRDQYLLKTSLGRRFVEFYYSSAPQYAGTIYNSPVLSFFVRSASYILYFVMNFFWALMLAAFFFLYLSKLYLFKKANRQ